VVVALSLAGVDSGDLDRAVRPAVGKLLLHLTAATDLQPLAISADVQVRPGLGRLDLDAVLGSLLRPT
jgi:hypothetical protein